MSFTSLNLVRLDQMTAHVVEQAYDDLMKALSGPGPRGDAVAQALMRAKQLLVRLDIVAQWASLKWEATAQCARVLSACDEEEHALVAAADQLAYLHSELLHTQTPLFDVCTAYKVLAERDMIGLLPKGIWRDAEIDLRKIEGKPAEDGVERMMYLLRARVLAEQTQVGATGLDDAADHRGYEIRFDDTRGSIVLSAREGLYEAELCLVPAPGIDVVVAKWQLGEAERKERERADQDGEAGGENQKPADMDVDGETLERARANGDGAEASNQVVDQALLESCASRLEFQWRWRVLSVKMLPALDSTVTRVSSAALVVLAQETEERLWVLSNHQVLLALGLVDDEEGEEVDKGDDKDENDDKTKDNGKGNNAVEDSEDKVMLEAGAETRTKPSKPPTQKSGLAFVDGRLRSMSSHVLIGVVVADAARALEKGTWKGAIKVGKLMGSNGILIDLWCGVPVVSSEEASILESSDVYNDGIEFDPRPHYASFGIVLDPSGKLTPTCSPDTVRLSSGEEQRAIVSQLCASDRGDGSNNLDLLLLRVTACLASTQLGCIRWSMVRQLEAFGNMSVHSSVVYHENGSAKDLFDGTFGTEEHKHLRSEAPRIDIVSCGEPILYVTTNLRTGMPSFELGSSIVEDGLVSQAAHAMVRSANTLLKEEILGLKTLALPKNASTSMYLCSMVARNALNLSAEILSFVSMRHLLAESPFKVLTACDRTPGVLIDASKHTACYRLDGREGVVGFLVLQTDHGVLGLQRAKFCVYDADLLRELKVVEEVPGWQDVLREGKRELSGSKRARDEASGYILREQMHEGLSSAFVSMEGLICDSMKHF